MFDLPAMGAGLLVGPVFCWILLVSNKRPFFIVLLSPPALAGKKGTKPPERADNGIYTSGWRA